MIPSPAGLFGLTVFCTIVLKIADIFFVSTGLNGVPVSRYCLAGSLIGSLPGAAPMIVPRLLQHAAGAIGNV